MGAQQSFESGIRDLRKQSTVLEYQAARLRASAQMHREAAQRALRGSPPDRALARLEAQGFANDQAAALKLAHTAQRVQGVVARLEGAARTREIYGAIAKVQQGLQRMQKNGFSVQDVDAELKAFDDSLQQVQSSAGLVESQLESAAPDVVIVGGVGSEATVDQVLAGWALEEGLELELDTQMPAVPVGPRPRPGTPGPRALDKDAEFARRLAQLDKV